MIPEVPLAVVGVVMLAHGLTKWREAARLALVGAAMICAAAFAYFIRMENGGMAFASGALLAACMLAALTTSRGGWRKPEVLLGMAAILTLVASNLVLPGQGELYFAVAAAVLGFGSVVLSLRSVISDIPADRGQPS